MAKTTVIIMVDGFDPEYLDYCPTSNLRSLATQGFMTEARAMMPTVTNVNNVSLITASYPEVHGITSNYWLNRETGEEAYMESGDYVLAETMFQRAGKNGARPLLVTANWPTASPIKVLTPMKRHSVIPLLGSSRLANRPSSANKMPRPRLCG